MKRWKVGLDVDDIIFSCNEYAVELTNSELHLTPPIQMNEITAGVRRCIFCNRCAAGVSWNPQKQTAGFISRNTGGTHYYYTKKRRSQRRCAFR